MRIYLIIFCLFLVSCQRQLLIDKLIVEAKELDSIQDYKNAIQIYDKILKLDTVHMKAYLNRGLNKSFLGDWHGAINDMTHIININPDNTLAYFNRAIFYGNLKEFDKAISNFNLAIDSKGSETIWLEKVENQMVENGFEFDVKMEEIRLERGIVYYYLDSLNKAYDDLTFSISESYNLKDSYYYRGLVMLKANNNNGCSDIEQSIKFDNKEAVEIFNKYCK